MRFVLPLMVAMAGCAKVYPEPVEADRDAVYKLQNGDVGTIDVNAGWMQCNMMSTAGTTMMFTSGDCGAWTQYHNCTWQGASTEIGKCVCEVHVIQTFGGDCDEYDVGDLGLP